MRTYPLDAEWTPAWLKRHQNRKTQGARDVTAPDQETGRHAQVLSSAGPRVAPSTRGGTLLSPPLAQPGPTGQSRTNSCPRQAKTGSLGAFTCVYDEPGEGTGIPLLSPVREGSSERLTNFPGALGSPRIKSENLFSQEASQSCLTYTVVTLTAPELCLKTL